MAQNSKKVNEVCSLVDRERMRLEGKRPSLKGKINLSCSIMVDSTTGEFESQVGAKF